jgi:hypothetical protein
MHNSTSMSWIRFILSSCFSCKRKTSGERSQICLDLQNYKPSWTSIEGTWYDTSFLFEMGSTPAIDAPLDSSSYHHSYGLAISVSGSWNANVLLGSKNSCFNSRHNSFQALLQLTGWWFQPLWKIVFSQLGWLFPIWKNKSHVPNQKQLFQKGSLQSTGAETFAKAQGWSRLRARLLHRRPSGQPNLRF